MKISLEQSELQNALSTCLNVVEKKATMPILTNVLLTAKENCLTISATDLEITAVINVPAETSGSGATTVNAKIFGDIVRELPEGKVNLELADGERLSIKAGGANLKINGVSAEEFPSLPGIGINVTTSISATQFLDMINKTIYAASSDETCFNLTGVYFCKVEEAGQDCLRLVSTDGHRLAIITRPLGELKVEQGVIVPKKGLSEIRRFLADLADAEIGIGLQDGFLIIDTQDAKFSMRLIDGEFPDYQQVIPKETTSTAKVDSVLLSKALRRVSLLVTDKMKGVRLNFASNSLKISSSSPELGEADEEISIEYQGDPVEVGFNAVYLQDIAASLGEDQQLEIELSGSLGPGKLLAASDPGYYAVVMPMRLT